MTPAITAEIWLYGAQVGLAFLAGLIVAATQLSTALCGTEDDTSKPHLRRKAWASFWIALLAAPLFGGTMTQPLVDFTHGAAPWPAAAVVVGISANTLWPAIGPLMKAGMVGRFKDWLRKALGPSSTPPGGST